MLPLRSVVRPLGAGAAYRRAVRLTPLQLRPKSTLDDAYQPPNAAPGRAVDPRSSDAKPHRAFYGNFGPPLLKGFLMALLTYQVTYWAWLKLESLETQREKEDELKSLEGRVKQLVGAGRTT